MRALTQATKIELREGDITRVVADAIVNAANASLSGGGGVDGAIHHAGGPSIMRECRALGSCGTGDAVITSAGSLHARYVIHAVAPRYRGRTEDALALRSAYLRCMEVASAHGVARIAFPSLGTGAYGYPIGEAAPIALRALRDACRDATSVREILFVLFKSADLREYAGALERLLASR
ncbi:MAG: O-acetyl-ADP-ribose deacetylase [Vulcanimicrobiaceae bacterium]